MTKLGLSLIHVKGQKLVFSNPPMATWLAIWIQRMLIAPSIYIKFQELAANAQKGEAGVSLKIELPPNELSTMSLANGPAKNLDYSGQLDASLVIGGLGLS